jgi:hypothetical protein
MPSLAYDVLRKAARDELRIQYDSQQLEDLQKTLRATNQRNITAIAGASSVIGGVGLMQVPGLAMTLGIPTVSLALYGLGAVLVLAAWFKGTD